MGLQWHQLDHMQIICTSLQTDNHASISSLYFRGQMRFLMLSQHCLSTEGKFNIKQSTHLHSVVLSTAVSWSSVTHGWTCTWKIHSTLKAIFQVNLIVSPPSSSSSSRTEPWDKWHQFLQAGCPSWHQAEWVSKHKQSLTLNPTLLASSFLRPPPGSWCCSHYAGFPKPLPSIRT